MMVAPSDSASPPAEITSVLVPARPAVSVPRDFEQ